MMMPANFSAISENEMTYILVRCGILLLLAVVGLACSLTAQYFSAKAAVGYSTYQILFARGPLIGNFIRTLPTFIRTCAGECGNPIP